MDEQMAAGSVGGGERKWLCTPRVQSHCMQPLPCYKEVATEASNLRHQHRYD